MSNETTVSLSTHVTRRDFICIDRLAKRKGMSRSAFVAEIIHALPDVVNETVTPSELDEFNRQYDAIIPKRKHKLRWYQRIF